MKKGRVHCMHIKKTKGFFFFYRDNRYRKKEILLGRKSQKESHYTGTYRYNKILIIHFGLPLHLSKIKAIDFVHSLIRFERSGNLKKIEEKKSNEGFFVKTIEMDSIQACF